MSGEAWHCNNCHAELDRSVSKCPYCGGSVGHTTYINPFAIIKPLFWLFKLGLKAVKVIVRLFLNKWMLTICTAGLSYIIWKGLDKVYGKKS